MKYFDTVCKESRKQKNSWKRKFFSIFHQLASGGVLTIMFTKIVITSLQLESSLFENRVQSGGRKICAQGAVSIFHLCGILPNGDMCNLLDVDHDRGSHQATIDW